MGITASSAATPPSTSSSRSGSTGIPSDIPSDSVHDTVRDGGRREQRRKENCASSGEESVLSPRGGSSPSTSSCERSSQGESSPLTHMETMAASLTNSASSSTMKLLDPLLSLLGPVARRFLLSQGITTVDTFLVSDSTAMGSALVEWRRREKMKEQRYTLALSKVRCWKRELRQRQETRREKPVGLHIAFEVFDPSVRSFLASQSIATPSDLRHKDLPTLALEFFYWREEKGMKELKPASARQYIIMWRESVERQGMELMETAAATLPPEELPGDSVASHDDAADVTAAYAVNNETLGIAVHVSPTQESAVAFDARGVHVVHSKKKYSAAERQVPESDVEKESTRLEKAANPLPLVDLQEKPLGLHIAFEVLDPSVRSFLASQSITTPSDLRHRNLPTLALIYFYWRKEKGMKELKLASARQYIIMWRESVERQGMELVETAAATLPPEELPGDSMASHDDAADVTAAYAVNNEALGITAHVSPAEESAVAFDARGVHVVHSKKKYSAAERQVPESDVEKESTRLEKAAIALPLVDLPGKTCAPMNTVADNTDPEAISMASKDVQESENDTMKMNATAGSAHEFDSLGKGHAVEKTMGFTTVIQPLEVILEKKLTNDATIVKAIVGYGIGSGGGGGSAGVADTHAPASNHQSGQSAESIQLDALLSLLGPLASRFLLSQGITTVDAFLASENRTMATALHKWREREKLGKRVYNTIMNEVKNWKHELRQRQETRKEKPVDLHIAFEVLDATVRSFLAAQSIATPSDLRLTNGPTLARSFNNWRTQQGMINLKWSTSEKCISMWRESVERQGMGLAETAAATPPPLELICDSVVSHDTEAEATSPNKVNSETLGMTAHVSRAEESATTFDTRGVHVVHSKKSHGAAETQVPESGVEKEPTRIENAANAFYLVDPPVKTCAPINTVSEDPLLYLLGLSARRFLVSQGITTDDTFLASENRTMATALLKWRKREKLGKRGYTTIMNEVKNWKRELRQRQETRREKPVGLHVAFEVLDPTVRSFLASQSIATPSDLRLTNGSALSRCFNSWRRQQGMINLKWSTSEKYISMWKESVGRQGLGLPEIAAATRPLPESQESENDAMKVNAAAESALTVGPLGMGRATEKAKATAATDIQSSEALFENEDTDIATIAMEISTKETISSLNSRATTKAAVDSASADRHEQGLAKGITPDSQRKRAQDESTETRHVEPSRKKLRYSVFWV